MLEKEKIDIIVNECVQHLKEFMKENNLNNITVTTVDFESLPIINDKSKILGIDIDTDVLQFVRKECYIQGIVQLRGSSIWYALYVKLK